MPSASYIRWRDERLPRLAASEAQCAASIGAVPPDLLLIDENLRARAMLLSAHFQGYCRDLYSECVHIFT